MKFLHPYGNLIFLFLTFWLLTPASPVSADEIEKQAGRIGGEIFGKQERLYHAYLALSETYDDNIFNTEDDPKSDFISTITPGIQLMVPGSPQLAKTVETGTTTPGGLVFGRFGDPGYRRFRGYLGYSPSFELYADNSDENTINHYAQAGLECNLRGGLSLNFLNRFVKDYDRRRANVSTQTDSYYSNLANLIMTYRVSEKILLRADYANFIVDYDDDESGFRNRTDNAVSGYVFYKFRPKVAAFVEYRYIVIDYDTDPTRDGDDENLLGGLYWDFTDKFRGSFRAGYGTRSYDDSKFDDSDRFVFEVDFNYRFTPKTAIRLSAFRRNEESPEDRYDYVVNNAVGLNYLQKITHKIDFEIDFGYNKGDYKGGGDEIGAAPGRKDHYFSFTPSLTYSFRRWLSASLAYNYRKTDSNRQFESYTANAVVFKVTGSI